VGQKLGKTAAVEFADAAADTAVRKGSDALRRASGAAAGGIAGVATKLLFEWNEPDKVHQRYVEHCLEKRGHRVLGWR
jgi:predicted lipoprotein